MTPLVMIGCVMIGYVSSNFALNVGHTAVASIQERSAFQSGNARSERALHEVLREVKALDQRIARIESTMQQIAELSEEPEPEPAEPPSRQQPSVR